MIDDCYLMPPPAKVPRKEARKSKSKRTLCPIDGCGFSMVINVTSDFSNHLKVHKLNEEVKYYANAAIKMRLMASDPGTCPVCHNVYDNERIALAHFIDAHATVFSRKQIMCCPVCDDKLVTREALCFHVQSYHPAHVFNGPAIIQRIHFDKKSNYEQWLETEKPDFFTAQADKKGKMDMYTCNRVRTDANHYGTETECTSFLTAKFTGKAVDVEFCLAHTHYVPAFHNNCSGQADMSVDLSFPPIDYDYSTCTNDFTVNTEVITIEIPTPTPQVDSKRFSIMDIVEADMKAMKEAFQDVYGRSEEPLRALDVWKNAKAIFMASIGNY